MPEPLASILTAGRKVSKPARVNVLGVGVSAINMRQALSHLDDWISHREQHYVCVTGVHGVMESQRDREVKAIHNRAGMVTPDGMPLVWLGRLLGKSAHVDRVYGPDLMLAVCRHSADRGWRHYFYGGAPGVPELLIDKLRQRFPALTIAGCYSPPFRKLTAEEDAGVMETINAAEPDIVWIGLSTPKQERWMAEHRARLSAPVLIGVGAAFDFHSGRVRQAPRWIQRSGMEWFFRMAMEPRRLWKRYATNNPQFAALIALQILGLRKFELI